MINQALAAELLNRPIALAPDYAHAVTAAIEGKAASGPLSPSPVMRTGRLDKRGAGIAVIPVSGILVSRGPWDGPDVTSYETLIAKFHTAAIDTSLQHVVLDINSPGGAAGGAFECAAMLRTLKSEKTITAVVNGLACSAAYAIASAANKIFTTPTGISGSIGVVAIHADLSRALAAAGIDITMVYAGKHKTDGSPYAPLSPDARKDLQHDIDFLFDLFVETVSAGRPGLSPKMIRETEARTCTGRDAVAAGLADEVGTLDQVLALLAHVGGTAPSRQVSPALPGLQIAAGPAHSLSSAAERERILSILTCPEAQGRKTSAEHLALRTRLSVEEAIGALMTVPLDRPADGGRGPLGLKIANSVEELYACGRKSR